jgi:protein-disulfide isomerase
VLGIAAGVIALVAVAVALGVILTGGKSADVSNVPTTGSAATGLPGASAVQAMLAGVPQKGLTLGSPSAPVTLVEYIDLQCPYCQQFETQVMPSIVSRYVRTGKVRVEARVLDFIGPDSSRGRNAMIAAGLQNKAFNFSQLLYDNQGTENTGWLDDNMVTSAASSIPDLNPRALLAARNSLPVRTKAASIDRLATADAVQGTPTLLVGRTGTHGTEVQLTSPTDEQSVVQALDAALAR